jgi:hypothetical protein
MLRRHLQDALGRQRQGLQGKEKGAEMAGSQGNTSAEREA